MIRFTLLFTLLFSYFFVSAQDMCSGATDLGNITCGALETGSGDASSTPDTEATGFCLDGINSITNQQIEHLQDKADRLGMKLISFSVKP